MISRALVALALPALVAGCGASQFDRDPKMSDLQVNSGSIPEVARVQVPMPPEDFGPKGGRAQNASLWSKQQKSLFSDQRADNVGDLLTVNIRIDDQAKLRNATNRERSGGGSIGFPSFFGYAKQIDRVLPGVGRDDLPSDNVVDLSSTTASAGSGSINRNESINLKMAALVIEKLPNGNLVIAGRQEVKVNQELRELRMAGIIRPTDIRMDNTIPYEKVAEARIAYGGQGTLSRQQTRSYGEDAMDIILPY